MRLLKKPEFNFENQWKYFFERSIIHQVGIYFKLEICGFVILGFSITQDNFDIGLLGFTLEIEWADYWTSIKKDTK